MKSSQKLTLCGLFKCGSLTHHWLKLEQKRTKIVFHGLHCVILWLRIQFKYFWAFYFLFHHYAAFSSILLLTLRLYLWFLICILVCFSCVSYRCCSIFSRGKNNGSNWFNRWNVRTTACCMALINLWETLLVLQISSILDISDVCNFFQVTALSCIKASKVRSIAPSLNINVVWLCYFSQECLGGSEDLHKYLDHDSCLSRGRRVLLWWHKLAHCVKKARKSRKSRFIAYYERSSGCCVRVDVFVNTF